jgi:hypothetical protein
VAISQACGQDKKFFFEAALRLGTDAELVFVGPALSAGAGINLGDYLSVSTSYTFYYARISGPETFMTHTVDLTPVFSFQNPFDKNRSIYFGLGPAWQYRRQTPEESMVEKSRYWLGSFNLGYRFQTTLAGKQRNLAIDLKAFGPYKEKKPHDAYYLEVLTQLMLGVRLRF